MRLLLDTNILLAVIHERVDSLGRQLIGALRAPTAELHVSVASLWELAIKVRLGKLELRVALPELPPLLGDLGLGVLAIESSHALAEVDPEPGTRDPFDRMLLAQCAVENLRLVTTDRVLSAHPLGWRPA
jgi:PIN domain nuclease of toxin-antitoxin system